jgi:hypothetical protein
MVLRLMPCSPRRRIHFCHRRCRLDGYSSPVGSSSPPTAWHQQRMPGPHGFAVRNNVVRPARCCSLTEKTALRTHSRADAAASTASSPAFVTIAIRPSCRERTGRAGSADLPDTLSGIFLREGLDDPNHVGIVAINRTPRNRITGPIDLRRATGPMTARDIAGCATGWKEARGHAQASQRPASGHPCGVAEAERQGSDRREYSGKLAAKPPPTPLFYRNSQAPNQRDDFIEVFVVSMLNKSGEPLNTFIIAESHHWSNWWRSLGSLVMQHKDSPRCG